MSGLRLNIILVLINIACLVLKDEKCKKKKKKGKTPQPTTKLSAAPEKVYRFTSGYKIKRTVNVRTTLEIFITHKTFFYLKFKRIGLIELGFHTDIRLQPLTVKPLE